MLVIPAIDLKGGFCVRLRQGRMDEATIFSEDPLKTAQRWRDAGARRLHVIDLDGAVGGAPAHAELIGRIARAYPELPVQVGGGIRTLEVVASYIQAGARYVIVGTRAAREPEFVEELCREFPGRIIVGVDVRAGMVVVSGWHEETELRDVDLVQQLGASGVAAIIYTDIDRDGMMRGANLAATSALARATHVPIIASGGISSMEDVRALSQAAEAGVAGMVIGRALYDGSIDLKEAQRHCDEALG